MSLQDLIIILGLTFAIILPSNARAWPPQPVNSTVVESLRQCDWRTAGNTGESGEKAKSEEEQEQEPDCE